MSMQHQTVRSELGRHSPPIMCYYASLSAMSLTHHVDTESNAD